jgi:hypothetical protein
MDIARRALFNSLRMNWLGGDRSQKVEPWQVEDYRQLKAEELFKRLQRHDIDLDRTTFTALAEDVDTPEQLADGLVAECSLSAQEEDQVYLLVFELWRRNANEKPSLSIFCDELDYQIFAYDHSPTLKPEDIQDAIANLEMILDENTDEGANPIEVFETISNGCANDIETFLYDYIAEQIDQQNKVYAADLLDSFVPYLKDRPWFDFLRARLLTDSDSEASNQILKKLVQDVKKDQDLDLGLEVLSFLAKGGDPEIFRPLARLAVSLLETEEDFQEILSICADYYHFLDKEKEEMTVQSILKNRFQIDLESQIEAKDQTVREFLKLL